MTNRMTEKAMFCYYFAKVNIKIQSSLRSTEKIPYICDHFYRKYPGKYILSGHS